MTCTLVSGATSATVRSPVYPETHYQRPQQIIGRAWAGRFVVCDPGPSGTDQEEYRLEFRDLTRDEYEDLRAVILAASGASTAISYTDPWGDPHASLRYVGGLAGASSSKGDRWQMTIELVKDMEA